jgi:hypothetical protein
MNLNRIKVYIPLGLIVLFGFAFGYHLVKPVKAAVPASLTGTYGCMWTSNQFGFETVRSGTNQTLTAAGVFNFDTGVATVWGTGVQGYGQVSARPYSMKSTGSIQVNTIGDTNYDYYIQTKIETGIGAGLLTNYRAIVVNGANTLYMVGPVEPQTTPENSPLTAIPNSRTRVCQKV